MSRRNKSKGKRINPTYWVFCEGETEKAYVSLLRSKYRLPIEIISKVSGSKINDSFIKKSKQGKPTHTKDKDFLLYDGDVQPIIEQLKKVSGANMILSTPSIELWFLYHYKNQKAHISSEECIDQLSKRNRNSYKKGYIDPVLRENLIRNYIKACDRAKKSVLLKNPSSNMFLLIEDLESVRKK